MAWRRGTPRRISSRRRVRARSPTLPVAHPQATPYPLVEVIEQLQLRGQTEVTDPAAKIAPQFAHPPFHRDAPATAGQLADATFELGLVLLRHVDRRAATAKDEAEVLDSVRLHDTALGLIHHQPQVLGEVAVHRARTPAPPLAATA